MPKPMALCLAFALAPFGLAACEREHEHGDDEHAHDELPDCVDFDVVGCTQLYPPTYDHVWEQTLGGCAEVGTACHAQADAAGAAHSGLTFVDPQATWELLTQGGHHGAFVIPGDAQCSPLFVRLAVDDPALRMPPGSNGLDPGALCSIATWIEDGAEYTEPDEP